MGVFKASKRFQIDSNLLIAIASQETSFREDLPEGKAGEFGIVQIRKIWIKNPKLRKHFKTAKLKDLNKPEKAFLYAAWILRDLKDHAPKSSIPFWSFYNAKGFQPRFRYFLAVNQKLSYLSKKISFTRDIANNIQVNGSIKQEHWIPDVRLIATHSQIPLESTGQKPNEPLKKQLPITTASLGEGITIEPNGWIAEALARLQTEPITQNYQAYNIAIPTPINQLRKPKIIASSKSVMKLLQSIQD